jgi:hypothetical protein
MKNKKEKYVITYTCIFTTGYVKLTWNPFIKQDEKRLDNIWDGMEFATKFRFKWLADLYCYILQKSSDANIELKTFYVRRYFKIGNLNKPNPESVSPSPYLKPVN